MWNNEYCRCPYNKEHIIVKYRMPQHLIKCRKNYTGPPLEACPFNATHLVPEGTMNQHFQNCQDFHWHNYSAYLKMAEQSLQRLK